VTAAPEIAVREAAWMLMNPAWPRNQQSVVSSQDGNPASGLEY
jgi:hypothetical protein